MPKMYFCIQCGRRHRTGKIYQDHLKFNVKKEDSEREVLLLKLAKINRKIDFGNYDKNGVNFLKGIRKQIKEKLK